jgi:hypothetical protein
MRQSPSLWIRRLCPLQFAGWTASPAGREADSERRAGQRQVGREQAWPHGDGDQTNCRLDGEQGWRAGRRAAEDGAGSPISAANCVAPATPTTVQQRTRRALARCVRSRRARCGSGSARHVSRSDFTCAHTAVGAIPSARPPRSVRAEQCRRPVYAAWPSTRGRGPKPTLGRPRQKHLTRSPARAHTAVHLFAM